MELKSKEAKTSPSFLPWRTFRSLRLSSTVTDIWVRSQERRQPVTFNLLRNASIIRDSHNDNRWTHNRNASQLIPIPRIITRWNHSDDSINLLVYVFASSAGSIQFYSSNKRWTVTVNFKLHQPLKSTQKSYLLEIKRLLVTDRYMINSEQLKNSPTFISPLLLSLSKPKTLYYNSVLSIPISTTATLNIYIRKWTAAGPSRRHDMIHISRIVLMLSSSAFQLFTHAGQSVHHVTQMPVNSTTLICVVTCPLGNRRCPFLITVYILIHTPAEYITLSYIYPKWYLYTAF